MQLDERKMKILQAVVGCGYAFYSISVNFLSIVELILNKCII